MFAYIQLKCEVFELLADIGLPLSFQRLNQHQIQVKLNAVETVLRMRFESTNGREGLYEL
jgi:hypothetical protein